MTEGDVAVTNDQILNIKKERSLTFYSGGGKRVLPQKDYLLDQAEGLLSWQIVCVCLRVCMANCVCV